MPMLGLVACALGGGGVILVNGKRLTAQTRSLPRTPAQRAAEAARWRIEKEADKDA